MKVTAAIRRSEAALLAVLVAAALLLTTAMAWRAMRAERRQRLIAARAIANYSTLIAEELARRTVFEYEEFGFLLIRIQIAQTWKQQKRLLSADELRQAKDEVFHQSSVLVDRTFMIDFENGTVDPPLPPDLQRWVLTRMPAVVQAQREMGPPRHIAHIPGKTDRWIAYMIVRDDPGHLIGILVHNDGLRQLAARALSHRSPFPAALGDRLKQDDLFLRIVRPGGEIFRTPGTFEPRQGRRMLLGPGFGDILGGATVECSFSAKATPILIAGGIPAESDAGPVVMLVATICVLGAVVLVQRRARELDRLRADFVAGVSHELRTPLTQIRIFAETLLLSRVRSEADKQRSLQNIARETTRLSHLVENLLSFSRGERGTLEIVRTQHDGFAIVREAVDSFQTIATPYRATFALTIGDPCIRSEER